MGWFYPQHMVRSTGPLGCPVRDPKPKVWSGWYNFSRPWPFRVQVEGAIYKSPRIVSSWWPGVNFNALKVLMEHSVCLLWDQKPRVDAGWSNFSTPWPYLVCDLLTLTNFSIDHECVRLMTSCEVQSSKSLFNLNSVHQFHKICWHLPPLGLIVTT